ncbi:MAG: hypothetical protein H7123_07040 [Thermoleophilia bacterium]|nr:hypothetical protein [Thermoleophilia bacterium]
MGQPIQLRLDALARDTALLTRRISSVVMQLPADPSRTPGVDKLVDPLYARAVKLASRSMSIAEQLHRTDLLERNTAHADRPVAAVLIPAWNAARSVAAATLVGQHDHAEITTSVLSSKSPHSTDIWQQALHGHDLPNVRIQGSIPPPAANLVSDRLENVPQQVIDQTDRVGDRTVLFSGKLTDVHGYMHLRGVHPRGWPEGATWDQVPGAGGDHGSAANASRELTGRGHGSTSLALHEYGHVVDRAIASPRWLSVSQSDSWLKGPQAEVRNRPSARTYLTHYPEEWFAESFARYSKSSQSAAALAHWYPETYRFMRAHAGKQQFSR